jgi:hypothetical protein
MSRRSRFRVGATHSFRRPFPHVPFAPIRVSEEHRRYRPVSFPSATEYGGVRARGSSGRNDCASVLQKTLDEEHMTDKKLTSLAEGKINRRAAS